MGIDRLRWQLSLPMLRESKGVFWWASLLLYLERLVPRLSRHRLESDIWFRFQVRFHSRGNSPYSYFHSQGGYYLIVFVKRSMIVSVLLPS